MAKLSTQNGKKIENINEIQIELSSLKISLNKWPIENEETQSLLNNKKLNDEQKEIVLQGLDQYFLKLKSEAGYQSRDLIVLYPELDGLDSLEKKFDKCHTHDDDEVRYIVDGEGVFGFVRPDGSQVELLVEAGEYINVPKNTEHWFYLTSKKRIKAVRYFTTMEGWAPVYTETKQDIKRDW